MVERIEQYGSTLKVILKPTKAFPIGYFYCDVNALDLVQSCSWFLYKLGKNICVIASKGTISSGQKTLYFHQEYAYRVLGYYPDYIDHINGLEFDNRDINLNVVTQQQNIRNRPTIGYYSNTTNCFRPNYVLDKKVYHRGNFKSEPEALLTVYNLRKEVYSDYDYDFFEDRRNFENLLDLEVKGIVSHEEANYLRAKQLIESNPWYVYRYNLFDYCKENKIVIPNFSLDELGFMIHPVTGKRLCPYTR